MMLLRLVERCFCVYRFYDLTQSLLSIPRFFWGNIINFAAGTRALYLYGKYLLTGKLIAWDKTSHTFPSDAELKSYHRKLGDLLLERRFLTVKQLDEALVRQTHDHRPLGAILLDMGLVKEEDLIHVLGVQLSLSTREIDPYEVPLEILRLVPHEVAVHYGIFPVEINRAGRLVVIVNEVPSQERLKQLEGLLGYTIDLCLTTRSNLAFAIHRGYQRLAEAQSQGREKTHLGQILLEQGLITPAELHEALKIQRQSYTRFGEILLDLGFIKPATLHEAIGLYRNNGHLALRDFLVDQHYITPEQMHLAASTQDKRFRRLGEVLVDLGFLTQEQLAECLQIEDARG